jgi:2-haloacid dehalogenase
MVRKLLVLLAWVSLGYIVYVTLSPIGLRPVASNNPAYERLGAYPEARPALEALRAAGMQLAILSNGAPRMLAAASESAGLAPLLGAVLSVEQVGIYKPSPAVYRLALDHLRMWPNEILFVSANGWDACGAKAAGLRVAWCNRTGQPVERLGIPPDAVIASLAELPALVGT